MPGQTGCGGHPRESSETAHAADDGGRTHPRPVPPRQGVLPARRHPEGRRAALLRRRAHRPAPPSARPPGVLPALPGRCGGGGVRRQEPAAGHPGVGAHGGRAQHRRRAAPGGAGGRRGAAGGRQPGLPGTARPAVARRRAGPGGPAGPGPRSGRGRERPHLPGGRAAAARAAGRGRAVGLGEDLRLQGPAPAGADRADAQCRGLRVREGAGRRAGGRAPGPGGAHHGQGPPPGPGAGRLVAEQRQEDHRRSVHPARPATADGLHPAVLGRARTGGWGDRAGLHTRRAAGTAGGARRPVRAAAGPRAGPAAARRTHGPGGARRTRHPGPGPGPGAAPAGAAAARRGDAPRRRHRRAARRRAGRGRRAVRAEAGRLPVRRLRPR